MDIGEELMVSPDAGFNSKTNGKIKTRLLRESLYITLVIDLVLEVLLKHHFLCFRVLENILHGDQVQVITIVPFLFLRDFVFHFPLFLIVLFFFFPLELIAGWWIFVSYELWAPLDSSNKTTPLHGESTSHPLEHLHLSVIQVPLPFLLWIETEWKENNQSHRHLKLEGILAITSLTLSIHIQLTEFLTPTEWEFHCI